MATEKKTPNFSGAFDFTKMMQQYKVPGVDFSAIMEREKKNIEALTKANKIAFEGWQALVKRQSEILQETMTRAIADARAHDAAKKRADMVKEGFGKALGNMRELAEMATKSQKAAFDVMNARASENVEELRKMGKPK